jgi:hypothetical protein
MAISEVKEIIPPKMKHQIDRSHDLYETTIDPITTAGDD